MCYDKMSYQCWCWCISVGVDMSGVSSKCTHLELTPGMSTPTLILALGRFPARKRFPETFISDNFISFKSVILKEFLRNNKIDWKFILDR